MGSREFAVERGPPGENIKFYNLDLKTAAQRSKYSRLSYGYLKIVSGSYQTIPRNFCPGNPLRFFTHRPWLILLVLLARVETAYPVLDCDCERSS